MAFTVEDGTGVADANTWTDIPFADEYFAERGNIAWAGVDAKKQAALINSGDYIHARFGSRWKQVLEDQVDPAVLYTFNGTIPVLLKRAQCEYALRALTAKLLPDPVVDANGLVTVVKEKTLGPLTKKYELFGNPMGQAPLMRDYPAADILLVTLINPISGRTYR